MIRIANAQLWVHDQDEALAFYTQKLGMEVRADVTMPGMGDFRWLTVGPPGQDDFSITLMAIPGAPVMDDDTADQVRALVAKGFAGTVFLTTDDVQASYEELGARRRVLRAARGASVRDRLGVPRPVRQQLPAHAGLRAGQQLKPRWCGESFARPRTIRHTAEAARASGLLLAGVEQPLRIQRGLDRALRRDRGGRPLARELAAP